MQLLNSMIPGKGHWVSVW